MTSKKLRLLKTANILNSAISCLILLSIGLSSCKNKSNSEKPGPHTLNKWLSWKITFNQNTYGGTRQQALLDSRNAIKHYLDSINIVHNTNFVSTFKQDSTSPFHYTFDVGLNWSTYESTDSTKPPQCPKPPPSVVVNGSVVDTCIAQ